jgi:hypothetical protein
MRPASLGDLDELAGQDETVGRGHAQQRFTAEDVAIDHAHDRLVVHFEIALVERRAATAARPTGRRTARSRRRSSKTWGAVTSALLGPIERGVAVTQKVFGRLGTFGDGDTHTGGNHCPCRGRVGSVR